MTMTNYDQARLSEAEWIIENILDYYKGTEDGEKLKQALDILYKLSGRNEE